MATTATSGNSIYLLQTVHVLALWNILIALQIITMALLPLLVLLLMWNNGCALSCNNHSLLSDNDAPYSV